MWLKDADGPNRLMIRVTGYQFPDAPDPARRFSWHMVGGEAHCQQGSWRFDWQALTCDESPRVSAWLGEVATSITQRRVLPGSLQFLEPNLTFRAFPADAGRTRILVSLDLEFQPPWHRQQGAGDPFALSFTIDEGQLRQAAGQWDAERAAFPDRTG
ncbi:MAG: WapI family immunity protein [Trebonia sp.]